MKQKTKEDHCWIVHLLLHNFFFAVKKSVLFINFKRSILLIYWSRLIFLDLKENKEKLSAQFFSPSPSTFFLKTEWLYVRGSCFSIGSSAVRLAPPQFFVDTSFYQGNQKQLKVKHLLKVNGPKLDNLVMISVILMCFFTTVFSDGSFLLNKEQVKWN